MPRSRFTPARIGALVALSVLLTWVSLGVTLNIQLAGTLPKAALGWWPWGAEAEAGAAGQELANGATSTGARRAQALAGRALAREPVLAAAARLLGVSRDILGGAAAADSAFDYAQAISRRDLPTQLWLIQRKVNAGDVAGALVHYDIALRSDTDAYDLLLPVLAHAADGGTVGSVVLKYLARRPDWTRPYLAQVIGSSGNPAMLATQVRAARLDVVAGDPIVQKAVVRLVELNRPDLARTLLGRNYSQLLHDGGFEHGGQYQPFDWWLRDDDQSLTAYRDTISGATGRFALHIVAKSDDGGEVARQLLLLPAGRYDLRGTSGGIGTAARILVSVTCNQTGKPVASQPIADAVEPHNFDIAIEVPAGCPAQWLHIATPPAETTEAWIDALSLIPASALH